MITLFHSFGAADKGTGKVEWTFLDLDRPEEVFEQLTHVYNNSFYEEDEPMPLSHIFGQQMWHSNAYLTADRTALLETERGGCCIKV